MWSHRPKYGFRFSVTDAIVILLCLTATGGVYGAAPELLPIALLFPVVLGHFFLFCNVFRIHRWLELTWAAFFLANVGVWVSFLGQFQWLWILATQTPITCLLIMMEIFSDRYHGVFSKPRF